MRVSVRLGEPIRRTTGALRVELAFERATITVADALALLAQTYPGFETAFRGDDLGHPYPYQVFVNARLVPPDQAGKHALADGDKVYVFLPAAGGGHLLLPPAFFQRDTLTVARDLLGQILVRSLGGQRLTGQIMEVEAYIGEDDRASHAASGPSQRNQFMYGRPGLAYVYLIYGMHHCLNVVTETAGYPAAILIRALQPLEGIAIMTQRRGGRSRSQLTDGPGKLCQALAIDRHLDGHDLTAGSELWLEEGERTPTTHVVATPRINVRGDEQARTAPWRFVLQQGLGSSDP
jgi:DNA-3-methyladenine glycosylase